jgi:hypothetical protein
MEPSANPTTNPTTAEQPLIEKTFPLQPEPAPPPAAPPPDLRPRRHWLKPVLLGLIVLVGLAGMLGGTYWFGYSHGKAALAKVDAAGQATALQVPGPVFNVFNGKVIGIEYMISPMTCPKAIRFSTYPLTARNSTTWISACFPKATRGIRSPTTMSICILYPGRSPSRLSVNKPPHSCLKQQSKPT